MFIISWFVILVLKANSVVVPALVSGIIGWLAIAETVLYLVIIIAQIFVLYIGWRSAR